MSDFENEVETFLMNFAIAGITSCLAKTFTAPIDRIKLILQNQNSSPLILTGKRLKYSGVLDTLRRIPTEQGHLSLWRGNGANLLRYIPSQALNFSFYDFFQVNLHRTAGGGSNYLNSLINYTAGGLAGACSIFTIYPLKFCQTRLSVDMGSVCRKQVKVEKDVVREFDGLTDCFKKISKKEGIPGLYKGFTMALMGSSMYRALYFGLFDSLKLMYGNIQCPHGDDPKKLPVLIELILAQTVTAVSGLCTYPLDTVGRRLMMESGQPEELKVFKNSWHAFKFMYQREGLVSFYKGALANCIRSVCGALILVFYDEFLYHTNWKQRLSKNEAEK